MSSGEKRAFGKRVLALVASAPAVLFAVGQAYADSPALEMQVPKLDVRPPAAETTPGAARRPLQGRIQHSEKDGRSSQRLRGSSQAGSLGGALRGRSDSTRLNARARENAVAAQAQSGIGIIGVKFVMFMGRAPVINLVFPQTPAYEKGLKPDDVIVAVDGIPTTGLSKEEVYDMIVGTPGTPVTLSLERNGDYRVVTMLRMDLNDIADPRVRRDYMMAM